MILIQNLSKLLKLSCWKSMLELPGRSLFCVFLGTYKDLLLFESRVFQISADLRNDSEIVYQIFLPLGIIKGEGRLKEQMVKDDPVYGKVKRLLVSPGQTMVSQKRNYKRYFLIEKGTFESRGESRQVIVKDVSMAGIGVSCQNRLLGKKGRSVSSAYNVRFTLRKPMNSPTTTFSSTGSCSDWRMKSKRMN